MSKILKDDNSDNTMKLHTFSWILVLGILLWTAPASAQRSKPKKSKSSSAHTQDDSRAAAIASARNAPDPFGFFKSGDQHKKNKDCACPGTKKGERQRRKEMRNHRKHR